MIENAPSAPPPRLGAWLDGDGVSLAVGSAHATAIECCVFDAQGLHELQRVPLAPAPGGAHPGLWTAHLRGARQGLVYGLRAHGPYAPAQGHRFNPHKLLLDPYAQEIVGRFEHRPEHHGYVLGQGDDSFDARDNAASALKARVGPTLAPQPAAPRRAAAERVLYEVHVKSASQRHPGVPEALRGTYAGLAHPALLAHWRRLGVTTLSLLPVFYRLSEPMMPPGLVNHWGYNTLGFFCPDPRFSSTPDDPTATNAEFRAMVAALHDAGLEVVLDVVFNHTPEGNHFGPTLSWRGLDHASWYRLDAEGRPLNWSACGNTLNVAHPMVTRFVLDSLRHWVQVMGVDGFRFDLAPVLGRNREGAFDPGCAFFEALRQDPVLAEALLIAEPWDAGPQGYAVGRFPPPWAEWNDRFRDATRGLWLGRDAPHGADGAPGPVSRREFAERFGASADLYRPSGRTPSASVNFIACHDGYTLADLVSHAAKHNHANGEGNRDGRDDELCANFGHEGPSDDPALRATRHAVQRAQLATLLLAHGVPMLNAGDEFGHSQGGNNNAWNQDNATGWLDWAKADTDDGRALAELVAALAALRRTQPLLRPGCWGEAASRWLALDDPRHALALHLAHAAGAAGAGGSGGGLLLAFNPGTTPLPLPPEARALAKPAQTLLDTAHFPATPAHAHDALPPRSLRVLQLPAPTPAPAPAPADPPNP